MWRLTPGQRLRKGEALDPKCVIYSAPLSGFKAQYRGAAEPTSQRLGMPVFKKMSSGQDIVAVLMNSSWEMEEHS